MGTDEIKSEIKRDWRRSNMTLLIDQDKYFRFYSKLDNIRRVLSGREAWLKLYLKMNTQSTMLRRVFVCVLGGRCSKKY